MDADVRSGVALSGTTSLTRRLVVAALVLLTLAVIGGIRLVDLDLDPPFTKRLADISDEGYWVHNARMKALTGAFVQDPFNQALITAPLYTAINAVVFTMFGTSLATARLTSAVAGLLMLVLGAVAIARASGDRLQAAAFFVVLGMNDLFFAYNRIGLVECVLNAFVFMAFMAFHAGLRRPDTVGWFAASGCLFGLAFLVKFTAVYVLLAFMMAFAGEWLVQRRPRPAAIAAWIGSAIAPAALGLAVMWLTLAGEVAKYFRMYEASLVGGQGLYYKLTAAVFNPLRAVGSEFIASVSVTLLLLLLAERLLRDRPRLTSLDRVCLYWLTGTFLTCAVVPLQADRRYWSLLIPLVIFTARAATWAIAPSAEEADGSGHDQPRRGRRWPAVVVWYLGTYATASVLVVLGQSVLEHLGGAYRLGLLQVSAIVVAAIVTLVLLRHSGMTGTVTYTVLAPLVAYSIAWNLTLLFPATSVAPAARLLVLLPVGVALATLWTRSWRRWPRAAVAVVVAMYVGWTGVAVGSTFVRGLHSVSEAATGVDRAIRKTADGANRSYVFGAYSHELVLNGGAVPLFFFPRPEFRVLNEEFLASPWRPGYYLHALPGQRLGALERALNGPLDLPSGLEGRALGVYCLYPWGDYCKRPVVLVGLEKFDREALGRYMRKAVGASDG